MVSMSRRKFLKEAALVSFAATVGVGNISAVAKDLFLKKLTPDEVRAMKEIIKRNDVQVKYSADVMCASECAIETWVKDGRVARIYGNPYLTYTSGGAVCAKSQSGLNLEYSP